MGRRQQWLRGVLDLCILGALEEQERHGYAIASRLEEAGLGRVKGGTLYPVLARLAAAGHLVTRWEPGNRGPGRKYYALTDSGGALLREQRRPRSARKDMANATVEGMPRTCSGGAESLRGHQLSRKAPRSELCQRSRRPSP